MKMLKDITFGQYYENKSFVHSIDPRIKILLMIIFIVFIFLAGNTVALLFSALCVFVIAIASKVPLKL